MVSLLVDGREGLSECRFGGVGGGGTGGVRRLEEVGVVFAGFAERVAEKSAAFSGKFPVLEAFEVGVGRDGTTVGGSVV